MSYRDRPVCASGLITEGRRSWVGFLMRSSPFETFNPPNAMNGAMATITSISLALVKSVFGHLTPLNVLDAPHNFSTAESVCHTHLHSML